MLCSRAIGIPLLHEHVSRALGTDMFAPECDRVIARGRLAIYSHKLLDQETASAAEKEFDGGQE